MVAYELSGCGFEFHCCHLNQYVYDFSADYDSIAADDILDILKYLIKKITWYKKCLILLKTCFL